MNRSPRISLPAQDISNVFVEWAQQCDRMVVYQHDADANVTATHCHILMIGLKVKDESLKRSFKRLCPHIDTTGGNKFWKWESKHPPDEGIITYMTKGILRPVFIKNFEKGELEAQRLKWVNHNIPTIDINAQPPVTQSKKKEKYDEFEEALRFVEAQYQQDSNIYLDAIRSKTMRFYWQRDGRLPPPMMYKRVAGTVFLKMVESREHNANSKPFCVAMEEIKDLWY